MLIGNQEPILSNNRKAPNPSNPASHGQLSFPKAQFSFANGFICLGPVEDKVKQHFILWFQNHAPQSKELRKPNSQKQYRNYENRIPNNNIGITKTEFRQVSHNRNYEKRILISLMQELRKPNSCKLNQGMTSFRQH